MKIGIFDLATPAASAPASRSSIAARRVGGGERLHERVGAPHPVEPRRAHRARARGRGHRPHRARHRGRADVPAPPARPRPAGAVGPGRVRRTAHARHRAVAPGRDREHARPELREAVRAHARVPRGARPRVRRAGPGALRGRRVLRSTRCSTCPTARRCRSCSPRSRPRCCASPGAAPRARSRGWPTSARSPSTSCPELVDGGDGRRAGPHRAVVAGLPARRVRRRRRRARARGAALLRVRARSRPTSASSRPATRRSPAEVGVVGTEAQVTDAARVVPRRGRHRPRGGHLRGRRRPQCVAAPHPRAPRLPRPRAPGVDVRRRHGAADGPNRRSEAAVALEGGGGEAGVVVAPRLLDHLVGAQRPARAASSASDEPHHADRDQAPEHRRQRV